MSKKRTANYILIGLAVIFVAFLALRLFGGCTDPDRARETLDKAGYEDITIKDDYQWLECGKDDVYATGFVATNPAGKQVEGVVCCGLVVKGCTIRF